jgi:Tfp pilus assembly protein PilF
MAALLLFGFLRRATGVSWPCAFVASIFALHPLHVESVAWIAERKDVLCAFFWFATLWAWLRYIERPGLGRYTGALALFSLGLMSKPMIVTLPVLLFLLDVWPFRRKFSRQLITEKIPFIFLSCAVMAITIAAQRSSGALQPLNLFQPAMRLENALVTVAIYIADTLWPARLWAPYAYPQSLPARQAIAAAAGITVASACVLRQMRKRPYLAVGWFWFLVTLIPVIGLVQTGPQARADRYTYVPMVGLSVVLAWGIAEVVRRWAVLRRWAAALGVAACLAMAFRTASQAGYWKDSQALFHHAIDMDSQNSLAWNYLGQFLEKNPGTLIDAIASYRQAPRMRPDVAELHSNLGGALCAAGEFDDGIKELRKALKISPSFGEIHANLAAALLIMGRRKEAIDEYEMAVRLSPKSGDAQNNLGALLVKTPDRFAEGPSHLEKAVEINPDYLQAQINLGEALLKIPDRQEDEIAHFTEALRMNPRSAVAHADLAAALIHVPGMGREAVAHLEATQWLEPTETRRSILDRLKQGQLVTPQ